MWTRTGHIGVLVSAFLALALLSTTATGQDASPDAGELLACFEVERSSTPGECGPPGLRAEGVLVSPSKFDGELVQAILEGLSHLAVSSSDQRVRIAAAIWLAFPGNRDVPPEERVNGMVDLIARTYSATEDAAVRTALVNLVWRQAEAEAAVDFLTSVATADPPSDRTADWPAAYVAIRSLLHMGAPGERVLRRLHEDGEVTNPSARGHLELLAQNGFRDVKPPH